MAKIAQLIRERIAGLLYGLFVWATRVPSSDSPQPSSDRPQRAAVDYCNEHIGLTIVLCSLQHSDARSGKVLNTCMVKPCRIPRPLRPGPSIPWALSSSDSSWSLSTAGDILGTESGVHMSSWDKGMPWENAQAYISRTPQISTGGRDKRRRDIPPPLTILRGEGAYRGPLPSSLSPGETTEPGLYLETIREDGRLIMNLVNVGDSMSCSTTIQEETGQEDSLVAEEKREENINVETAQREEDRKGKRPLIEEDNQDEIEEGRR